MMETYWIINSPSGRDIPHSFRHTRTDAINAFLRLYGEARAKTIWRRYRRNGFVCRKVYLKDYLQAAPPEGGNDAITK